MNRQIWTSTDRDEWIDAACASKAFKGFRMGYHFQVLPKSQDVMDDPKRNSMTEALATLIYKSDPKYRCLSLGFYNILMGKIVNNPFTAKFIWKDVMVVVKGSNAYALLLPELPFSDLDIMIYINPSLPDDLFKQLQNTLKITVMQTQSQFKKTLDHMFFLDMPDPAIKNMWMDDETIEQFKHDHIIAMRNIGAVSVFEGKEVRNHCSRHSFMLMDSIMYNDKVVRIDVPHFEMCDRIPLRFTPIFCSYNNTINYEMEDGSARDFGLFRIKFNNMMVEERDEVHLNIAYNNEGDVKIIIEQQTRDERVAADFIDVTIADKNDSELIDFWATGRCTSVFDPNSHVWVVVPDMTTCAKDLYKMLHVYDCPESKRSKRQHKFEVLMKYIPWYNPNN